MAKAEAPTAAYQKIADANRKFYASAAKLYERTESCMHSVAHQQRLESALEAIPGALGFSAQKMKALDACGGSGNVALKLLRRGMEVTLCDISPEMLRLYAEKCAAEGYDPNAKCSEVAEFLGGEGPKFHLITFSSAIHHLQNIEFVLKLAFQRLEPGGAVFTIFDPTSRTHQSRVTRAALMVEYTIFKVFSQPADFPKAVWRRIRRIVSGDATRAKTDLTIGSSTIWLMAEYHVEKGIDDAALAKSAEQMGFEIAWHKRRPDCRFGLTRWIARMMKDCTEFELLLRKPG